MHQIGKASNKERPQKYILQEEISISIHIVSEAQGKKFDKRVNLFVKKVSAACVGNMR